MRRIRWFAIVAAVMAIALIGAACGGDEPSWHHRRVLETARRGSDVLFTRRSHCSHRPRTASAQTCSGRPSSLWSVRWGLGTRMPRASRQPHRPLTDR